MLRAGIAQDWRLVRYYFWRGVMRAAWWCDLTFMRLHTAAFLRASRLDPWKGQK